MGISRSTSLVAAALLAAACATAGGSAKRGGLEAQVVSLRARGDWEGVERAASARLRVAPHDPEALTNLVVALVNEDRAAEAIGPARALVAANDHPMSRILLGQVLAVRGEPAAAEQEFREALRRDGALPAAHWGLAGALGAQGRYREAAQVVRDARAKLGDRLGGDAEIEGLYLSAGEWRFPAAALEAYARGSTFMAQQRWTEAGRALRAATEEAPEFARARQQLARSLLYSGDRRGAEVQLRLALEAFSPTERLMKASALADLAAVVAQDGRAGQIEARNALRDAIDVSPRPDWVISLAGVCAELEDLGCLFANALRVTRLVAVNAPPDVAEHRLTAAAYLRSIGCWSDAHGQFDPSRCVIAAAAESCLRGGAMLDGPPSDMAVFELERGAAAGPQHGACWANLARALDARDETVRAESAYRSALSAPAGSLDDDVRARLQGALASLLIRSGSTRQEIVDLARHARARLGNEPFYVLVLGRACEVTGDKPCAIESFRRILATEGADQATRARAAERLRVLGVEGVPNVVAPSI